MFVLGMYVSIESNWVAPLNGPCICDCQVDNLDPHICMRLSHSFQIDYMIWISTSSHKYGSQDKQEFMIVSVCTSLVSFLILGTSIRFT